ncbi:GNAT family N-acetyltransferase [Paenalcaligenes sp. Me131]|uniref:GNAT family N-acetyltransferase n=1 Tax=Paenalcaligenes sp. Me131 TaxID=3392636 RepID=UPI003D2A02A7
MTLVVTIATTAHQDWLVAHDTEVAPSWVQRCVAQNEYIVAERQGQLVGFLRYSLFWGKIPFMDMIRVQPEHQRRGVGRALLHHWERLMLDAGATLLMTSAQADEPEPLAWHQRNGFREAGAVQFGPLQAAAEVFLLKAVT